MNAPVIVERRSAAAPAAGTVRAFALFHLNLAFSSIEEETRGEVIARCYWPLLALCESCGPLAIEATGYTLEEIQRIDPSWIAALRTLIASGRVEFVGSGYAQIIGPLVPARVMARNLALGHEAYERILDVRPHIALVNEQAYSAGLVGHYLDAGYRAILMDWDNPAAEHPHWPAETRFHPQRARGADGREIALLWTNTVFFQKLQRLAHGDIELGQYLDFLRSTRGAGARVTCLYASDAEVFDHRPGRYRAEDPLGPGSEWRRIRDAFAAVTAERGFVLVTPSAALEGRYDTERPPLTLESANVPVPVKKQRKYNLTRWAVTGRDDIAINAACERIYRGIAGSTDPALWRELLYLWSSDFRTHITDTRWRAYCDRLARAEASWGAAVPPPPAPEGAPVQARHIPIATPSLTAVLDRRRGLAITQLARADDAKPVLGGLPHGHFDDIALQADWYTGDCVFEAPGEPKVTDLEWCDARIWRDDTTGDVLAAAHIPTVKGPIAKTMRFAARAPRIDFDLTFHWEEWGKGSLRLGHFTLVPEAFLWDALCFTTHNGGAARERFPLAGAVVDHGAPVSFLVSASCGLGLTEGWAEIGDGRRTVRIEIDRTTSPCLGLVHHRRAGGSLFCQFVLSALELDDTRKPDAYRAGPRRFRFSVTI